MAAAAGRLDYHPIARRNPPTAGRFRTDLLDDADGLMPGNHRQRQDTIELAVELVDVAATDTTGLHPQQRVVCPNPRQHESLDLEALIANLNDRTRVCHLD